ncbi:hypothetical protein B0A75_04640 [Flavobacterium oncorhynchi]|uniref:Uncharacterized protein n=1 Tax=Flavobacterium oncorhynchi TaxID=728056 RepID=A0A226I6B7_9FLAO|nr:hypothetical protein [Flavobacterium oncorhynchi]OXB01733.1 hypothetical protein B0A75_04640 [Flavobacterium oncorhynchi]
MNWKELKDFCNNLPESELEKNVMLWREDEVISDISAQQLNEDNYIYPPTVEDGCFPESEMKSQIEMSPSDYPKGVRNFTKIYDKGHPVLVENF